jgi:wobble nucleotide-excising tRNase
LDNEAIACWLAYCVNQYNAVYNLLEKNKSQLEAKIKAPSQEIPLLDSANAIQAFNDFIEEINQAISTHNKKIDNKDNTMTEIKEQFWALMRWDYDQNISTYQKDKTDIEKKTTEISKTLKESISSSLSNKDSSISVYPVASLIRTLVSVYIQ